MGNRVERLLGYWILAAVGMGGVACSKPSSTASVQILMPTGSGVLQKSVRSPSALTTDLGSWGARAIESVDEINCYVVTVGGASSAYQAHTCQTSDEAQAFTFGPSGVAAPGKLLTLEVEPGRKELRVFATHAKDGRCPDMKNVDPRGLAQFRQVGKAIADIRPGTNDVTITADLSGPVIDHCGDSVAPILKKRDLSRCLQRRSEIDSGVTFLGDRAVVMLKRDEDIGSYISELPAGISAAVVASYPQGNINSHLVLFTSPGTLATDLAKLCGSDRVSFVEPVESGFQIAMPGPTGVYDKVIVAVLGTGVDYAHSFISAAGAKFEKTAEIINGVDDDLNGFIDDRFGWNVLDPNASVMDADGFGTGIAGRVLAGAGAVPGTSPTPVPIRVMPVKSLDDTGSGYIHQTANGILAAVDAGAAVVVLPYQMQVRSRLLERAMYHAMDSGVLVVTAAGNEAADLDLVPYYPSAFGYPILTVASITDAGLKASFSNFGKLRVHLASRGVAQYTTKPAYTYGSMSGTSISAGYVAGFAGKLFAGHPTLSMMDIRRVLLQSGTLVTTTGSSAFGMRLLNEAAAETLAGTSEQLAQPIIFYPQ